MVEITVLPSCFIWPNAKSHGTCLPILENYFGHTITLIVSRRRLWDKRKCLHWDLHNRNWSAIVDWICTENSSQLFSTSILHGGQRRWLTDALGRPLRNAEVSDQQKFSGIKWKKIMPTETKDRECMKRDIWPSSKIHMGNNMVLHAIWC